LQKARDGFGKFKSRIKLLKKRNKSLEGELNNKTKELNDLYRYLEKNKGNLEGNLFFYKVRPFGSNAKNKLSGKKRINLYMKKILLRKT
jgi:hypothetical protein